MIYIIHENLWWWGKSYYIITNDGKAMVGLSINEDHPKDGYVHSLIVLESERQKGLGNQLLQKVESIARELDLDQIYLQARKGTFVVDWYRRHGFEIYDENPEDGGGQVVAMNKWLKHEILGKLANKVARKMK